MKPEKFEKLIEKLSTKTQQKQALWNITSEKDEFKLDFENGFYVVINKKPITSGNKVVGYRVSIVIYNPNGEQIDRYSLTSTISDPAEYKDLDAFFNQVKRGYLKVDESFDEIFKELDSNKIIGKEKDKENQDKAEELPF